MHDGSAASQCVILGRPLHPSVPMTPITGSREQMRPDGRSWQNPGQAPGAEEASDVSSAMLTAATKWLGRGRQGNQQRSRPGPVAGHQVDREDPTRALQSRGPRSEGPCRPLIEEHPPACNSSSWGRWRDSGCSLNACFLLLTGVVELQGQDGIRAEPPRLQHLPDLAGPQG